MAKSPQHAIITCILYALIFCSDNRWVIDSIQIDDKKADRAIKTHCVGYWDDIYTITRIRRILNRQSIPLEVINKAVNRAAQYISKGNNSQTTHFTNILKFDAIGFPYVIL
ncbi:unnamed protein product [Cuscuta epithymum]|uniref:Uncharacterized protein n=1 Tax=Cuscuta epithymum TaxID=186058 RepID=A0AAV0D469_9ASTE|nr:unnamed protein product [Cuscuta epithymum]